MRASAPRSICCAVGVAGVLFVHAAPGVAQESLSGSWEAGATSMEVAVQSWGKDCGPRPQSSQSSGGGNVQVEQRGQVLTIRGADRDVRSDRCWSPNSNMRRVSSSAADGLWTTRCKTAADDPRQEIGTYTLKALSVDRMLYQDVSHFDWKLKDSTCIATITTTQTLIRRAAARGEPAATSPGSKAPRADGQPAAATAPPCVPGPPARLLVRPRRADLELGQRQCFHARVLDAKGCAIEGVEPSWQLDHGRAIKGSLQGSCFLAGERSAEAEGAFKVIASHAGLKDEAEIQVSAVSLPALLAKRMETGAVKGEPEPAVEAPTERAESTSRVAAKTLAEPGSDRRWLIWISALLAAAAAVLLLLRARPRARQARKRKTLASVAELPSAPTPTPTPMRLRRCPTCGASYPETSAFCGTDGSALTEPE